MSESKVKKINEEAKSEIKKEKRILIKPEDFQKLGVMLNNFQIPFNLAGQVQNLIQFLQSVAEEKEIEVEEKKAE
jgi:hypothetical protein